MKNNAKYYIITDEQVKAFRLTPKKQRGSIIEQGKKDGRDRVGRKVVIFDWAKGEWIYLTTKEPVIRR